MIKQDNRLIEPGKTPHYSALYSDELTNALARIGTGKKANIEALDRAAYQIEKDKNRIFKITESGEISGVLSYNTNAVMIMDLLLVKLAQQLPFNVTNIPEFLNLTKVSVSVSEFMEEYGIKDRKTAKELLKNAADQFLKSHVNVSGKYNGETVNISFTLINGMAIFSQSGNVIFSLNPEFAFYMNRSRISYLPLYELKQINRKKYRHAYLMGRYIFDYYSKNEHKQSKSRQPGKYHANILSVKSILKNAPGIPTKEEIEKKGRHYYRDIISPFIENMDELENIGALKEWYFTHKKGKPLTDQELGSLDIDTFLDLNIYFEPKHPIKD